MHIATGLSTTPDARAGALEAASAAARGLDGRPCDLAVLFASGAHLAAPDATLVAVHEMLSPMTLVGCGAGGVISDAREIEDGTAVSVWAASLGDGEVLPFHATVEEIEEGSGALSGLPDLEGAAGAILLADPFSFPTDAVLRFLSEASPLLPLLGGMASARTAENGPALFLGDEVVDGGAVGVRLDGVEILPCVSQGAAPIGPELTITAADGHVIGELAGKPALAKLREAIEGLSDDDRELVDGGLLMGIVVDANKPDYIQGDFLVSGLVGADPETGEVAVGAEVRPGQVVRLHARDASSADRDLHRALSVRMEALGGRQPAGALVFACNGRGSGMFGIPGHDAEALASELHGRAGGGLLRRGRDRAGRGRVLPAQLHGHGGGLRAVNLRGPQRPAHRRDRGHRPGDRAGAGRARRAARAHGPPRRRARAARGGGVAARAVACDLSRAEEVTRLLEDVGDADVLVANAALPASGVLTSFSVEEIDRALAVNLRAPIVLARALSVGMVARGHGHLVFVSSLSGKAASPARVGLLRDEVRPARLRARAARGPARQRRRGLDRVPRLHQRRGDVPRGRRQAPRLRRDADARAGRRRRRPGDRAQPLGGRRRAAQHAARRRRGRPRPRARGAHPAPPRLAGDRRRDGRGPAREALALGHVLGGAARGVAILHARGILAPAGPAGGGALRGVALTRDRGDRGQHLVGEPRAVGLGLGRGGDPDDDLVGVDLLERDVRLGADRRADAGVQQLLDLGRLDVGAQAGAQVDRGGLAQRHDGRGAARRCWGP